jgi:hypothetical protein
MCDPITASIALTVAGTAAQAAGQNRARKAMQGAQNAERIRQKGLQDQSEAVQQASEARGSKANQDKEQAAAEASRNADYAAATEAAQAPVVATGDNIAGDQTANAIIANETANASRNALNFAAQQGNAKAALQGFSDLQLGNALANARANEQQRTLGNFMRGSSDVLGLEMEAASRKGDNLKTLGTLLNAGGMITGMGAGAGWWGGGKTAGDVANIGTTATTTLQPGMTIDSILKPAAPLTLQNFNQGGNVMQLGSRLSGGTYDPSTGTTYFKLR